MSQVCYVYVLLVRIAYTTKLSAFGAANMYNDMREEARDHARVRNAYFDQVIVLQV